MSIITKMRLQKAVYWRRGKPDGFGGYVYDDPVEIDCRWQDVQEEYIGATGVRLLSRSVVFPDRLIFVGDMLKLGNLDDLLDDMGGNSDDNVSDDNSSCIYDIDSGSDVAFDPASIKGIHEVMHVSVIPNLRNTEVLYKVFL